MSTFEDYAALARQLAELRREGERSAVQESHRLATVSAEVNRVADRLAGQHNRLYQLSQVLGQSLPETATPVSSSAGPDAGVAGPVAVSAAGLSDRDDVPAGQRAVPPPLPTGRPALPTAAHVTPTVPGPRGSVDVPATSGGGRPSELDPAVELDRARQAVDAADGVLTRAEEAAQRPPLLPTWSPLPRALAVYGGCTLVAAGLMMLLVVSANIGLVDSLTLYTWMCTGLPAIAFFAGYLVLTRWGRPAVSLTGQPSRYVYAGFAICFVALPFLYCGYLVLARLLVG